MPIREFIISFNNISYCRYFFSFSTASMKIHIENYQLSRILILRNRFGGGRVT